MKKLNDRYRIRKPNWKEKLKFQSEDNPDLVEIFIYHGYKIPLYFDDSGQSVYTIINNKEYGFGGFNFYYQEDCKFLIDQYISELNKIEFTVHDIPVYKDQETGSFYMNLDNQKNMVNGQK